MWPKIFNVLSTDHFHRNSSWSADSRIRLWKACSVEEGVAGTGSFWAIRCNITVGKYMRNNVHYICMHYIVAQYCWPLLPYISRLSPGNNFWHKHKCRGDKYRCAPIGPCFSSGVVLRDTHWPKSNAPKWMSQLINTCKGCFEWFVCKVDGVWLQECVMSASCSLGERSCDVSSISWCRLWWWSLCRAGSLEGHHSTETYRRWVGQVHLAHLATKGWSYGYSSNNARDKTRWPAVASTMVDT